MHSSPHRLVAKLGIPLFILVAILGAVTAVQRVPAPSSAGHTDYVTQFLTALPNVIPSSFGVGITEFATADLNTDGNLDVLAADYFNNEIHVLLGDGDGNFYEHVGSPHAVSGSPDSLRVSDLDGDTVLDVVVANTAGSISFLKGDGTGDLAAQVTSPSVSSPEGIAVAYLDADTDLDLLVTRSTFGTGQVAVQLNNGDGTFAAPSDSESAGSFTSKVDVGDFNGDGKTDAAAVASGSSLLFVFLGNGDGTITPATTPSYSTTGTPKSIVAADFVGDAAIDLVTEDNSNGTVKVFEGDGSGGFTLHSSPAVPTGPWGLNVLDVNNDGLNDIAVGDDNNGPIRILRNNGTVFEVIDSYTGVASHWAIGVGDFDGEGTDDIITGGQTGAQVSILLNDGTGTLNASHDYTLLSTGANRIDRGDLNGDGHEDFVIGDCTNSGYGVYLANGTGGFTGPTVAGAGGCHSAFRIGNVNGDTFLDIVGKRSTGNIVSFIHGNGDGTFGAPGTTTVGSTGSPGVADLQLADINGVGGSDIVTTNASEGTVSVRLNDGVGTFTGALSNVAGFVGANTVAPADYDADGDVDIVVGATATGYYSSNTAGVLGAPSTFATGGVCTSIRSGLLNADALPDLVMANACGAGSNTVIKFNTGGGTFGPGTTYGVPGTEVEVVDVDLDGIQDVVVRQGGTNLLFNVLGNDGTGVLTSRGAYHANDVNWFTTVDLRTGGTRDIVATGSNFFTHIVNITGTPEVLITPTSGSTTVTEGGATDTLAVELVTRPTHSVTLTFTGDSQVSVAPTTMRFTQGDWSTPQTLTVTAIDDTAEEGPHAGSIGITTGSFDANYDALAVASQAVTVNDNDTPGAVAPNVQRISGDTPQELAIAVSQEAFTPGEAEAGAIARSGVIVDSLTLAPLASIANATMLLTNSDGLETAVKDELLRALGSTDKTIYLAGGLDALSQQVETDLQAAGFTSIVRLAGAHRRATAGAIGDEIINLNPVKGNRAIITDDRAFVDALGTGGVAANVADQTADAVVLSQRGVGALDESASAFLDRHQEITEVIVVGGTTALPEGMVADLQARHPGVTVTRWAGPERFATNAALNGVFYDTPNTIVIANGEAKNLPGARTGVSAGFAGDASFFAALLGGRFAGEQQAPLLVTKAELLPVPIEEYITAHAGSIEQVYIIGPEALVNQAVMDQVGGLI